MAISELMPQLVMLLKVQKVADYLIFNSLVLLASCIAAGGSKAGGLHQGYQLHPRHAAIQAESGIWSLERAARACDSQEGQACKEPGHAEVGETGVATMQ